MEEPGVEDDVAGEPAALEERGGTLCYSRLRLSAVKVTTRRSDSASS